VVASGRLSGGMPAMSKQFRVQIPLQNDAFNRAASS
jgi:hypothetical protein